MPTITEVLQKLDPVNNDHWTAEGLPRLDVVKLLSSNPGITREAINAAQPGFNRATAATAGAAPAAPPPPVQPPAPQVAAAPSAPAAAQTADFPNLGTQEFAQADLDDLNKQIEQAELVLSDASNEVHEAQVLQKQAQAALDVLLEKRSGISDNNHSQMTSVQSYLARQREVLNERAARKELIKASGIDLKQLTRDLKAPIDAMRQRRAGR